MSIMRFVVLVAVGFGCLAPDGSPPPGGAFDIVERSTPEITSVTTQRGFAQIRQSATVPLVIRGKKFQGTVRVTVGPFFVTLDSVEPHEVHVTVFTFGSVAPGPLDVSLTAAAGTTTAAGAVELTPIVVSPTATDGDGTFQSPTRLCDLESPVGSGGALLTLLAGTHLCGRVLEVIGGITVQGDPNQPTIVAGTETGGFGFTIEFGNRFSTTVFRDLTFAPPVAFASISTSVGSGSLLVERVTSAGTLSAIGDSLVTVDHYTHDGEGNGIEVSIASITNSTLRHCGAGDGVVVRPFQNFSSVALDHVVVEDCEHGVTVDGQSGAQSSTITNTQFLDNRVGIHIVGGFTQMSDSEIRNVAPAAPGRAGISIERGDLFVTNTQISGQDVGASISQFNSDGRGGLAGDGITIEGGRVGVSISGIENSLSLHNSTVRDQTDAAAVIGSVDSSIDFGTSFSPGNNALSVVSGFVIDDRRRFESLIDKYIQAVGTTLNGFSFDGQTIDGPAELAPFYRIADGDSGIQF
jgi:hypothetical protein